MQEEPGFSVTLWSTDVFAMTDFLQKVAGLAVHERHPGYAALATDAARIMVHADEAYQGHPWYQALAREGVARGLGAELRFRVANLDASYARARALGALVIAPPYEMDGARECQLMGPDSYLISLWQPSDLP